MESNNYIGIWMDYSSANLIDNSNNDQIIRSGISPGMKEITLLKKGEKHMHLKEQQMLKTYFKEIASRIADYDQVLLFGPTNAKVELRNFLTEDGKDKQMELFVEPADKMTANQKNAFVKGYFNK